jgi:hypothetical protein
MRIFFQGSRVSRVVLGIVISLLFIQCDQRRYSQEIEDSLKKAGANSGVF